ncbi:MAG: lipid A biosynthesis acyltransferase [Gammaproteobacteria bacterium]|nr:lipid A biosynthesis acyltransferase [Gammaproteobacteria bacterium]
MSTTTPASGNDKTSAAQDGSRWTRWRGYAQQSGKRFWLTLFGLGMLRAIHFLPFPLQLGIAKMTGQLTWLLAAKPRKIIRRNLDAYFPSLSQKERRTLERRQFESLAMAVVEVPFGWWASPARLKRRYTIDGLRHIEDAQQHGRGVLLLGFHFTMVEFCGLMLCRNHSICAVFRPYKKNPLADEFTRVSRSRIAEEIIERDDVPAIARRLRDKKVVFFAGDMLVRPGKRCEVLPFFGVPTLFHSGAVDLARMTKAIVVPYFPLRLPGGRYRIQVLPALDNFPSGDRRADMQRVNALLEEHVLADPSQYLWARDRLA